MSNLFVITRAQRDALISYLVTKPFGEVAGAVQWLEKLPPAGAAAHLPTDGTVMTENPDKPGDKGNRVVTTAPLNRKGRRTAAKLGVAT